MITLERLTKSYRTPRGRKLVADDLNVAFRTGASVALLGRNGAGKSTLLKMIAGTVDPDRGRVLRRGSVSWPVGFGGSFHPDLTGAQNTRFVARVHGVDSAELVAFVADFAELGDHFHMPLRTYSSGMRSRLAFGISMGVPFDTYLVDEITAVGDAAFRDKSTAIFRERLKGAGAIVVSHSMPMVRELCTAGAVLEGGRLELFEDIDAAIARHEANMAA
jgi:capsular polysaccharide transport system ATP-binding protein